MLAAAALAAIIATDFSTAQAQSDDEATGRIVARLLDDGRVEFGWQPSGSTRVLPEKRYFPASVDHNRWLRSSPVEVDGAEIGRINARQSEDGRIEFAFTPTGGERILTDARYFPTDARPNRWLRSTEITISTGPIPFIAVSTGRFHTCAIRSTGAIECWGASDAVIDRGQTDAPEGSFTAVAVGDSHTCAIRTTGAIECWGYDSFDTKLLDAPEGSYTAISAGNSHTCAIRESDGEIECWGQDGFGRGVLDAPKGSFTAISGGKCAIAETFTATNAAANTGEIECWGDRPDLPRQYPAGRYTAISANPGTRICVIRADGAIECVGSDNDFGENDISPGRYIAVSATGSHTCAIHESGEIACWGYYRDGQTDIIPPGRYIAVSASGNHTCAIRESGEIACWGYSAYGQTDAPAN